MKYKYKYKHQSRAGKASFTARVKKIVRKTVNQEVKVFDSVGNLDQAYSTAGATLTIPVSDVQQGDALDNRTGNTITAKHMDIKLDFFGNANNSNNAARILLVLDKFNQGTAPAINDVLSVTGDRRVITSQTNKNHLARYKVLMDKVITFQNQINYVNTTATVNPTGRGYRHFYARLHNRRLNFQGNGASDTYGSQLYILIVGDVSSNDIQGNFSTRLSFTDS